MIGGESVLALVASHGLWLIAPLALLEGPIVTVLSGWLAGQGALSLWAVVPVVVAADLAGDAILYALGRRGPDALPGWLRRRWQPRRAQVVAMARHFRSHGGRTLLTAKLTHVAGLPVMLAAGAARMPLASFLVYSLLGTIPKCAAFLAVGWTFGAAWQRIDGWLWWGGLGMAALLAAGAVVLIRRSPA